MGTQTYLVALGSNMCGRRGRPRDLLATLVAPAEAGAAGGWGITSSTEAPASAGATRVVQASRIHASTPLGPGKRSYANAVALITSDLTPPAFLDRLKSIERAHGRRPGRRWGDRVLDLDIIGWSGGRWRSRTLVIPHAAFRTRRFVLAPLAEIAAGWRDPVTRLSARHLLARLDRASRKYPSDR